MAQAPTSAAAAGGAPSGKLTYEEFLDLPDDLHAEWVDGEVVPLVTVGLDHTRLGLWLLTLLMNFLESHPLGELAYDPFQMKTGPDLPGRAPDILFVRSENAGRLRRNYLEGPGDLVIEIVSPGGESRDRGEKFLEYERGGVPEYWVLDPHRRSAEFHQLDADGVYRQMLPDADGVYRSAQLDGFWIRVDWLWALPKVGETLAAIEAVGAS